MSEKEISKMDSAVMHATIHAQNVRFLLFRGYSYSKVSYFDLEYNPSIETKITDLDMLLFRIDHALENTDEELFLLLTDQLREVESWSEK